MEFIRKYGVESTNPVARELNENWLRLFFYPFEVRRRIEARGLDPTDAAKAVEPLVSNAEEDLHAFVEGRSSKNLAAAECVRLCPGSRLAENGDDLRFREPILFFLTLKESQDN